MGEEYDTYPLRRKVWNRRREFLIQYVAFREDTLEKWCATEVDAEGVMVPVSFNTSMHQFLIHKPKIIFSHNYS